MNKELIVAARPKSDVAEAIKTVRTNLQFSAVGKKVGSILITSSMPGEGKSFISSNLAVAFAQNGSKVLVVDCDMRKGRIHKVFGVDNEVGLSNLLIDDVEKKYKKMIKKSKYENISILPMGVIPPNPAELLNSEANKKLVKLLAKDYDIVIYDGVPLGMLTDSLIMAELVDKIILVAAYKQTPVDLLVESNKQLKKLKNKIAGVILNKYKIQKNKYYDGYYQ